MSPLRALVTLVTLMTLATGCAVDGGAPASEPWGDAATQGSAATADVAPQCAPDQAACGGRCVDLARNASHCGACGRGCGAGERCDRGACMPSFAVDAGAAADVAPGACGAGLTSCGAYCADLATDLYHCGDCTTRCAPTDLCTAGRCMAPPACPAGLQRCGGACFDFARDRQNCGGCGQGCAGDGACVQGICVGATTPPAVRPPGAVSRATSCAATWTHGCGEVVVPRGEVTLGDPEALDAAPPRPVAVVDAFAIDVHEVTLARFRRFWDAGHPAPTGPVRYPRGPLPWDGTVTEPPTRTGLRCNWTRGPFSLEDHPINCVNWQTAQAFCVWDGGRLPTEAEWERAARGDQRRAWAWGDEARTDGVCWLGYTDRPDGTCPVASQRYAPDRSLFGLAHMAGNVTEWTADRWSRFGEVAVSAVNPLVVDSSAPGHVTRGAAWDDNVPAALRVASRFAHEDLDDHPCLGFRCVRPAP